MSRRPLDEVARETASLLKDLKRSYEHNQERWRVALVNRVFIRVLENQVVILKTLARMGRKGKSSGGDSSSSSSRQREPKEHATLREETGVHVPAREDTGRRGVFPPVIDAGAGRHQTGRLSKLSLGKDDFETDDRPSKDEVSALVSELIDDDEDLTPAPIRERVQSMAAEDAPLMRSLVDEEAVAPKQEKVGSKKSSMFKNIDDVSSADAQSCISEMPVPDLNQWIEKDKSPFRIAGQHVFMNPNAFAPAAFDTIESHIRAMGFRNRLGVLFVKDMVSPVVVYGK